MTPPRVDDERVFAIRVESPADVVKRPRSEVPSRRAAIHVSGTPPGRARRACRGRRCEADPPGLPLPEREHQVLLPDRFCRDPALPDRAGGLREAIDTALRLAADRRR